MERKFIMVFDYNNHECTDRFDSQRELLDNLKFKSSQGVHHCAVCYECISIGCRRFYANVRVFSLNDGVWLYTNALEERRLVSQFSFLEQVYSWARKEWDKYLAWQKLQERV